MLFDLRSRRRRRAVQVIYVGLAILMLGGLVLFGVGAGQQGGLLNAFTNNGSSSGQSSAVNAQTKAALKAVKEAPKSPAAWAALIEARYTAAGEGSNFDSTTGTYTTSGKVQLRDAANAWTHYLAVTNNKPNVLYSTLIAETYGVLAEYSSQASAWEYVIASEPTQEKGYFCLAASAYAAKQTRKGELAAARAIALAPKLNRLTLTSDLNAAKTSKTAAVELAQEC